MIRVLADLHQGCNVTRSFGAVGAPWEFNLRDLLRWCHLASDCLTRDYRFPSHILSVQSCCMHPASTPPDGYTNQVFRRLDTWSPAELYASQASQLPTGHLESLQPPRALGQGWLHALHQVCMRVDQARGDLRLGSF